MTSSKWKTEHRRYAFEILEMYRTADGFKYLRLHNDDEDYDLGTLTHEGVVLIQIILSQHQCGTACATGCAVLHLAWVIEGCPDVGEPLLEAFKRNHVEIVGKSE